jgi:hypothetical protein
MKKFINASGCCVLIYKHLKELLMSICIIGIGGNIETNLVGKPRRRVISITMRKI